MPKPLVYVRSTTLYPVPPVCSAAWTADAWQALSRRYVEPLVLEPGVDFGGRPFVATGERDSKGRLLYRQG